MKSYFLHQHKILNLHLLFIATVIAFALPANISYGAIDVEVVHVETAQYPIIQAYVSVWDTQTGPIEGLDISNFALFEDLNQQTLLEVIAIPLAIGPISVAIAMDYSSSMSGMGVIPDMEDAALVLVNELRTDPADAGEIIKFHETVEVIQIFTTDKEKLRTAIEGPWESKTGTTLYDALYRAIQDTAADMVSRNSMGAVVVITDGMDSRSEHTLAEVIDLAQFEEVRIFAVGLGAVNESVLAEMAGMTGGAYFIAPDPSDLTEIFSAIVTVLYGGYLLSYETSTTGCDYHLLWVRVDINGDGDPDGEDIKEFLICLSNGGGGGGGGFLIFSDDGGGCSMSNPEGQINISHPVILVGIFALGLLVWRKRRRR